eukprot:Skav223275  [mRNA]  locus=scaffold3424:196306:197550:+ [translate_table: standard]
MTRSSLRDGAAPRVVMLVATFTAGFACGFTAASPRAAAPTVASLWVPAMSSCSCEVASTSTALTTVAPVVPPPATTVPTLAATTTMSTTLPAGEKIMVKVFAGGNGRLGNNIGQLLHGIAFARRIHADKVQLVASGGQIPQIFDLKDLTLDLTPGDQHGVIPKECNEAAQGSRMNKDPNTYASGFWTTRCAGVPGSEYHALALEYMWPLLKPEIKTCIEQVDDSAEKRLTVHLRGQDLWGMGEFDLVAKKPLNTSVGAHHWLWSNPPCSMYAKVIQEEGYSEVLVVTSPDKRHACIPWFEQLPARLNSTLKVTIQAGSLADDFCALVRARNMVVSFSTLSNAAAVLSKQLKRIYVRNFAANSMLNCNLWPEVSLVRYDMKITEQHHEPYNNTYAGVIEWFQTYKEDQIHRTACK